MGPYESFFITSAGASAALLGLLQHALVIVLVALYGSALGAGPAW